MHVLKNKGTKCSTKSALMLEITQCHFLNQPHLPSFLFCFLSLFTYVFYASAYSRGLHISLLNLDLSLDGENLMDLIPRSCKFPLDVVHYTQVLSMESLQKEGVISEPLRPDSGRQPIAQFDRRKTLISL